MIQRPPQVGDVVLLAPESVAVSKSRYHPDLTGTIVELEFLGRSKRNHINNQCELRYKYGVMADKVTQDYYKNKKTASFNFKNGSRLERNDLSKIIWLFLEELTPYDSSITFVKSYDQT